MSQQTFKLIAKEFCQDKRQCVAKKKWEESENSAETKKVYVATRFFRRMSTLGRICSDKEAPIATNETGRKHKLCRDKASSVMTQIIAT